MSPKLKGLETAGRRGLGDGVGEIVQGQVCFSQIGNSPSVAGVGAAKVGRLCPTSSGEIWEGDELRAAWAPRQTYFRNLHTFGQLSYQLALWLRTP